MVKNSTEQSVRFNMLIIASFIAILIGLFALFQIYQNSKTDGFGRGSILVEKCQEKNWAWKIYECSGFYTSGAGMYSQNDATVTVTGGEYQKGDQITDVYAPAFAPIENTRNFITGKERSSVSYNFPWLALLFAAILLPVGTIIHIISLHTQSKKSKRSK